MDLDALKWLLGQQGEKVFITDEGFCGGNPGDEEKAHELLNFNRHKVTVVRSVAKAIEMYEK